MSHSRAVVMGSFAAALFLGAGLGEVAWAATPAISAGNASISEGDSGSQTLNMPVTRSGASTEGIAIQYRTDTHPTNPASADTDYVSISAGSALLPVGSSSLNLPVLVYGDTDFEPSENFYLSITSVINVGPTPTFGASTLYGSGNGLGNVISDFNGDGRPDLAYVDGSTVLVMLNTAAAGATAPSFSSATPFGVGTNPNGVAAGDLNGDGKADLAVANAGSNNVSVLINTTPAGAAGPVFAAATQFSTGAAPVALAIRDFNGDGKPDLSVANVTSNSVSVLFNTTTPGSTAASFSSAGTFGAFDIPRAVTPGDFNGDGKPDLAVAGFGGFVSVLLNTAATGASTPAFAAQQDFATLGGHFSVSVDDINGDGKPDLAVSSYTSSVVSVLLNTTTPGATTLTFSARQDATTDGPYVAALRDLNGDGRPDLIAASYSTGNGSVLLNLTPPGSATATFGSPQNFGVCPAPIFLALGELNGDGKPDLTGGCLSSGVFVVLNTTVPASPPAAFAAPVNFTTTGSNPVSVAMADFNGDGKPDLSVANLGSNTVSVLLDATAPGAAIPAFSAPTGYGTGINPASVATGDLNGDGKPDLVVANLNSATVSTLLNNTSPGAALPAFLAKQDFSAGNRPTAVAIGDLNGDGRLDLVAGNFTSNDVSVLINTTSAGATTTTFAAAVAFGAGINPQSVALGDLNGDGKLDLVVANINGDTLSVFLGTTTTGAATPTFATKVDFGTGNGPYSVAIADVNGDGRPDLATANYAGSSSSVLLNTTTIGAAAPTFATAVNFRACCDSQGVAFGDLNGDGRPDLAVANQTFNNASGLINTTAPGATTASFAADLNFNAGAGPSSVAIGDINGDGRPDLAVANSSSNNVSILINSLYGVTLSASQGAGTIVDNDIDTTPNAFAFIDETNVALNSTITSGAVTISGTNSPSAISVSGGSYSVGCTATFVTSAGTISSNDTVCVRQTSSAIPATTVNTVLTIGGVSDTFSSTTEPADNTPFAFAFTDASAVTVGSVQESNTVTITGINTATAVSVSGGEYRKNGSSYTTTGGSVVNGDTVQVRHTASLLFSTATDTTLTVGGVSDTFTSTTEAQDTTPNAFSFADATNAVPGSAQESDVVTIGGINSPSSISVSGGEYRIDSGTYTTTAATVQAGQTVQVRHTASSSFATNTDTTLTIGGVSDTFTSTTAAQDTTPDSFAFTDVSGAALGATQESNVVTIGGITGAVSVTASGGEYRKNGGSYTTSAGTVSTGDTLQLRHTAAATPATTVDTMLTVGSVSDTFSSTTVPADTTPVAFGFTDPGNVTPGSTITSDTITVAGINTGAAISVTGGSYRIDSGAFTSAAGTVQNGQTVQVQHTASSSFAATTDTTLTIGGVSDTFTSTTAAQDTTPNAFTFTDVTEIAPGSVQESGVVTIDGITGAVAATVNGGEYRKNGGAYTSAAGTVVNGDTLQLRQVASNAAATTTAVVLTVGTMSDSWSVTTASPPAGGGGGGGPLSPVALLLLGLAYFAREARSRCRWLRGAS